MNIKNFQGSKSGGSDSGSSSEPDTFFTEDSIEIVLGISEGMIKGLKGSSARNFYVGDTPLENVSGGSNFEKFQLQVHKGSPFGELIVPRLGGGSSSISVATELANQTPVVRQGQLSNIDWLELRFTINALYNDEGEKRTLNFRVEYKASSAVDWKPGIIYRDPGLDVQTSNQSTIITLNQSLDAAAASRRQVIINSLNQPVLTEDQLSLGTINGHRLFWVNGIPSQTKVYRSGEWYTPDALDVDMASPGQTILTFEDLNYVRVVDPARPDMLRRLYLNESATPALARLGDIWSSIRGQLWFNGTAWVDLLPAKGEYNPLRGEIVERTDGRISIKEKVSSPAVKELRLRVARIAEPYQVRVTKLTSDSDGKSRSDITWESIQEINSDPLIFPNLATVHLSGQASDQFSSIPEFWGVYEGRIVRVPSNYDPVARTYEGVWDAAWKLEYSNNPAFVVNDLVMNDRYGIASAYPVELDPFDVYAAGQWCDLRVGPNNRPQFTFNGLISEPRGAREAVTFIAGTFGGRYFDDGDGYARLKIDKDDPAVHLFTKEKVDGGIFTYGYTEMETRKNDYTVAFINPDLGWKEDRRRVFDSNHIETYGRVPEDFIATGCTNAEEAIARARQKLISDQTEKETITFNTNRAGLYLEPYDIFLVADDAMEDVVTGRISGQGADWLELRDAVYLEAGFTHKIVLSGIINGEFGVHELTIANSSVGFSTTRLNLTGPVPADLPEQAVFTTNAGKPYRLLGIDEVDNDPDKIQITGIEVNRNKWTQVHTGEAYVEVEIPRFDTDLSPISNMRVVPRVETAFGRPTQHLSVSWDRHPNKFIRRYELYWQFNGGPWNFGGEFGETSFNLGDVKPGDYVFSVRAVSFTGQKSIESYVDIDLRGSVREVVAPINLQLVNRTAVVDGISHFEGTEARVEWERGGENPDLSGYDVLIYNDLEVLVRTDTAPLENYTYGLSKILEDAQTRRFSIAIRARDVYGNRSDEVRVFAFNPPPGVLTPTASLGVGSSTITWPVNDLDYAGTLVWVSETEEVETDLSPAFDLTTNGVTVQFGDRRELFVVLAGYDYFGKTELNYSSVLSILNLETVVDTEPPAVPTWVSTNPITSVLDPVTGRVRVYFRWNDNTEVDFAGYELQAKEGTGEYVTLPTTDPIYYVDVLPGALISARLRARDRSGNVSNYSAVLTHTAAKDTTAPAVPIGFTAVGGPGVVWLKVNRNTEADFHYYEFYQSTTTTAPVAGTAATFASRGENVSVTGLPEESLRYFWSRAIDTSGNKSAWGARVQAAAEGEVSLTTEALAGLIDQTSFAATLSGMGVGATLPAAPFTAATPKTFYLTSNKTVYTQKVDGTGWVNSSDASLIVGELVAGQIKAGAVGTAQLATAAATIEKLSVVSRSLVNGFSSLAVAAAVTTATLEGWTVGLGAGHTASLVADADRAGATVLKLTSTGAGNPAVETEIPVDPSQTYQISAFIKKIDTGSGSTRVRIIFLDKNRAQITGMNAISPTTRAMTAVNSNIVNFYTGAPAAWTFVSSFILASGADPATMPMTINADSAARMPAHAAFIRLSLLAVASGTTPIEVYFASPSLRPVGGGQIHAEQIAVETLHVQLAKINNAYINNAHVVSLSAAKIEGGTALLGTVTVENRALGSIANTDVLFDTIDRDWLSIIGPGTISYDVSGGTGSRSLVSAANGAKRLASPDIMAFDPTKLYRVTYVIKRLSGTTGLVSLGVQGIAADRTTVVASDGTTNPLSASYCVLSNVFPTGIDAFTTVVGYVRGHAAAGGLPVPGTLALPTKMHPNVRHIRPFVIFNNGLSSGGSSHAIDSVKIEVVTEEAAALVNVGLTKIDPGMITVFGNTTFADWRYGGDLTQINGGVIGADTVNARALNIGMRGIKIEGIEFEHNSPALNMVSWTAGFINYIDDNGVAVRVAVNAGSYAYTGTGPAYLVWLKGSSTIVLNAASAFNPDRVIMAIYKGNRDLIVDYGRTIIDGFGIKTGSVTATQLDVVNVRANILIVNSVKGAMIDTDDLVAKTAFITKLATDIAFVNSLTAETAFIDKINANVIRIGQAPNLLPNSDFKAKGQGTSLVPIGWSAGFSGTGYQLLRDEPNYTPPSTAVPYFRQDGVAAGYGRLQPSQRIPVVAGQRYQASWYVGTHRCNARIYMQWFNAAGVAISAPNTVATGVLGGTLLSQFFRMFYFETAPAGAATCNVIFQKDPTFAGQANSFLFFTRVFFGEALPLQTEPSPWSNGAQTVIGPGYLEADSVTADNILAGTITADEIVSEGVTKSYSSSRNDFFSALANNTEQSLHTLSISSSFAPSVIGTVMISIGSGNLVSDRVWVYAFVAVYRNGVLLFENRFTYGTSYRDSDGRNIPTGGTTAFGFKDAPGVGTHSYEVRHRIVASGSDTEGYNCVHSASSLILLTSFR